MKNVMYAHQLKSRMNCMELFKTHPCIMRGKSTKDSGQNGFSKCSIYPILQKGIMSHQVVYVGLIFLAEC